MDYRQEAVVLAMELSLPDGYWVKEVEGRWYLFDPQGIPLHAPSDPSLLEAYAWRHAWRRIDRELNEELVDFHAGVRPLHRLRRLRQYTRMLDAIAGVQEEVEAEGRRIRRRVVAWGALGASAAAVAAVLLLITPLHTPPGPGGGPGPAALSRPAPTTPERPGPASPSAPSATQPSSAGPVPGTAPRRSTLVAYAVSFGKFLNRTTADSMMHFIRSKGYIVYVARIGEEFWVVTRPYHTHTQAERLVGALQEIGFPAELTTARAI